jgi:hypothetical protein
LAIDEDLVKLSLDGHESGMQRRRNERPVPFVIDLTFREARLQTNVRSGEALRTLIEVVIHPVRNRDRRRRDAKERALQLMISLQSYLMAHEITDQDTSQVIEDDNAGGNKAKSKIAELKN